MESRDLTDEAEQFPDGEISPHAVRQDDEVAFRFAFLTAALQRRVESMGWEIHPGSVTLPPNFDMPPDAPPGAKGCGYYSHRPTRKGISIYPELVLMIADNKDIDELILIGGGYKLGKTRNMIPD